MSKKKKAANWEGYVLKTKQVQSFTVSEASMRHAFRRVEMIKHVQGLVERNEIDPEVAPALAIYPHLAGCVTPIISVEQFLEMPEVILDELMQAVMELNPHWFPKPDQEKKTGETQTESTDTSATS